MKTIFLAITIDVEPDCTSNWVYSDPLTFHGVSKGVKQILHPMMMEFGMEPTYLINNVVLEDRASVDIFRSLPGKFELGTHLHPEFIEPEKVHSDYAGKKGEANCCFLSPAIEFEKLKNITNLYREDFGFSPISFRAGRFSAGVNTIHSLMKLGYKVDSSVTPGIIWKDVTRENAVDYSQQGFTPYWLDETSFPSKGKGGDMLEVPVTIVRRKKYLVKEEQKWLRPFYSTAAEMIRVSKQVIRSSSPGQPVVLNMMFHNVEVLPGLSPYAADQAGADKLIAHLREYFNWCVENDIKGRTLSGIYEKFS